MFSKCKNSKYILKNLAILRLSDEVAKCQIPNISMKGAMCT